MKNKKTKKSFKRQLVVLRGFKKTLIRANSFSVDGVAKRAFLKLMPLALFDRFSWFFFSFFFGQMANKAIEKDYESLMFLSFGFAVFMVVDVFSTQLAGQISRKLRYHMDVKLEKVFSEKKASLGYADKNNPKIKDIVDQADSNKRSINELTGTYREIIISVTGVVFAAGVVSYFEWWYGIAILAGSTFRFFLSRKKNIRIYRKEKNLREFSRYKREISEQVDDYDNVLNGSMGYFLRFRLNLFSQFEMLQVKYSKMNFWYNISSGLVSALIYLIIVTHFFFSGASKEGLSIGDLLMVANAIGNFRMSFNSIVNSLANADDLFRRVKDLFVLLDYKNMVVDGKEYFIKDSGKIKIEFKDVWFRYPDTENWILKGASFVIKPGERIGLVGDNGAGKTTLIQLLLRYYDPQKGAILVNNQDLRSIKIKSFYKEIGALMSGFSILNSSIREAIRVGDVNQGDTSYIYDVSKYTSLDPWVQSQPQKYDQKIGSFYRGGVKLSSGTAQKVGISKVFYRKPSLIILDEPTSALSPVAEQEIFDQYNELCKGKTTIMISHRFKSLERVSRILVLEDGIIVEDGTHVELMKKHGTYRRLFKSAQLNFDDI